MSNAVYDYVKKYRERLDAPNILEGTRLQRVAQEFWRETSNEGTALDRPIRKLGEATPLAVQFVTLWNSNYAGRRIDASDSVEEKQEILDEIKREANLFLSMMPHVENERGILSMKGMSKEGLSTLPPELQREVEAFLSPSGRSEERAILISQLMAQKGLPGVRSDVRTGRNVPGRGPPPPPPGGAGPAAAGAGGPAGGKRRKTRKGKSRRRYSRRR
jgi:hypothetical protein